MGVFNAESSGLVGALVTIDTGVSLNPGELEQGVVAAQEAQEVLEQGAEGTRGGKLEHGEVRPAIPLHG